METGQQTKPFEPFFANAEWLKSVSEASLKFYPALYKGLLGIAGAQLQTVADYVKRLATCNDANDIFECNTEAARKLATNGVQESEFFFEKLRANLPSNHPMS